MRSLVIGSVLLIGALAFPTRGLAQSEPSHWGVVVNFTPEWNVAEGLLESLFQTEPNGLKGSEFQIGIARGRTLSGDWGVSFVHRKVNQGSTIGGRIQDCTPQPNVTGCDVYGEMYTYDDVTLTGFEVHKFVPFVTIRQRVQVGVNFSGGFGVYKGTTTETIYSSTYRFIPPNRTQIVENPPVVTPGIEAKTLFVMERVPMGKLEASVAGIVAPGLKVRAGYGLDFPGYPVFSLSAVYLFGGE